MVSAEHAKLDPAPGSCFFDLIISCPQWASIVSFEFGISTSGCTLVLDSSKKAVAHNNLEFKKKH